MNTLERIRAAAKAKGWDLARVAMEAHIERSQIYQISGAKRGTSKHLSAIAAALGVEIGQLTGETPVQLPIPADTAQQILAELKEIRKKIDALAKAQGQPAEHDGITDRVLATLPGR